MIGGQGEKKTLRLMAEHAEMANFTAGFDELPHKLEVLAKHCSDVGRDIATINKTPLGSLILGDTMEEAEAKRSALLQERGLPSWDQLDDGMKKMIGARFVVGDADAAGEQLQQLLAIGIDGFTFNMPADGWDLEAVARAGAVVSKAVS
jgi:alkanesulfonate monooxygenase SsuD/methylene tetrahydromethanopterin reductase-like flavin-dependent oxidoreductase (luciferase family)